MTAKSLILASVSPRRKYWLDAMSIPFEIVAPFVDETPLVGEEPIEMVMRLSKQKAISVAGGFCDRWVLAADTTVVVNDVALGKPENAEDALNMLRLLQGRKHSVHTGICMVKGKEIHQFVDTSDVYIRSLTEEQIRWYVSTGEPTDKAGAYAAQGIAALFIERIEGSFATVMGLPVERLGELFFRLGLITDWLGMPNSRGCQ